MQLILNELSYSEAVTEGEARSWYDTFFDSCLFLERNLNTKINIRFSDSPATRLMHADIPFGKWLSTIQDIEEKRSILSMLTSEPIIHDYPYFYYDEQPAKGLGYAFDNDWITISFCSDNKWKKLLLELKQEWIDEDKDIVLTELVEVRNCYNVDSAQENLSFLVNRTKLFQQEHFKTIKSGQELWDKRSELFPSLLFCDSTETFITGLSVESDIYQKLVDRVSEYDYYFSNWTDGDFDRLAVGGNPVPESETRERIHKNELTIKCPDDNYRFFTLHCRFGIKGYRMHFFPDSAVRNCIIGYIGKKIL